MSETGRPEGVPGVTYAPPDPNRKPLYLLADSQLLFWRPEGGQGLLESMCARLMTNEPMAAYVGASNGDDPAFYSIFEAAMESAGITRCRMIPSDPGPEDLAWLDEAHLVVLAGGDVGRGWSTFEANGLKQILQRRYFEGALLIGVSAGAVQLGLGGWAGEEGEEGELVETFRLVPYAVGAHEEKAGWAPLKAAVRRLGALARGYGLPMGAGLVYHPDHTLEPLRGPIVEIELSGHELTETMVLPGNGPSTTGPTVH